MIPRITKLRFPSAHAQPRFASPLLALIIPLGLILLLGASLALADASDAPKTPEVKLAETIRAQRLKEEIAVDAILDEAAWQKTSAAPLIQNEPENGVEPHQDTDWWIAYDTEAIYVACRMFDSSPDSIVSQLARRDYWPASDMLVVNFDTQNDDRTGYTFAVNPVGVVYDNVMYNDGWDDPSWDGVWDCAARIDEQGWTAEFRIPFSQLNFPDAEQQVWGVNISRRIERYRSRDELFHRPRGESGFISRFPDLVGIQDILPGGKLEIKAYGTSKAEFLEVDDGDPFRSGQDFAGNSGLDLKWGLTSNLTLNATLNPDFGQVEVDPAVVNLSDFETYFPEQRPFFVEGANTFRFGREGLNNNWGFNWMDPILFYSRRVGRSPQLSIDNYDYADKPTATTILGAAKLGGKIGNSTFGMLSAVTGEERAKLSTGRAMGDQLVEPRSSYSVLRAQRARADGSQGIGIMATGVWRDDSDPIAFENLTNRAVTGGVDGWLRLDEEGTWAMRAYLSGSQVTGSAQALESLQHSSRRYYQRPDADHVDVDPTRTSLSGWASRVMINKQRGDFSFNSALGMISPGYEINDLGFQTRADQINGHVSAGYKWLEPGPIFRSQYLNFAGYHTWDSSGTPDNNGIGVFYDGNLANYWHFGFSYFLNPERNSSRATRGGPLMRMPRVWETSFSLDSDRRKSVQYGGGYSESRAADGSLYRSGRLSLTVKPSGALKFTLSPRLAYNREVVQYVTQVDDVTMASTYGTRYIYSGFDYYTLNLTTRLDWTFSPKLSLQTFVQPYIAAANYDNFREYARPSSYDFNDYGEDGTSTIEYDSEDDSYLIDPDGAGEAEAYSLGNPDFNFKSFKLNCVLRWEYLPGSTFYLVWTQDRAQAEAIGNFKLGRDMGSLFDEPSENIFMAKITHWFGV